MNARKKQMINRTVKRDPVLVAAAILTLSCITVAQSGSGFQLERSAVSNSGGSAAGGTFTSESTTGQAILGVASAGGSLVATFGFWASDLAPTAAPVSLSGKVRDAAGRGLPGAMVILSDPEGNVAGAVTSSFGNFRFEGLPAGGFYILSVSAKGTSFKEPVIFVNAFENIDGLEFIAIESQ